MEQILFLFLAIALAIPVIAIVKPQLAVNASISMIKVNLKLMALEGEIRSTPRSLKICRIWNILLLFFFLALIAFFRKG